LYVFRQEVAKHTGKRYDDNMSATWDHWSEEMIDGPSDEAREAALDQMLAAKGVSEDERKMRGDGVFHEPRKLATHRHT
jgi:hypothetical protein